MWLTKRASIVARQTLGDRHQKGEGPGGGERERGIQTHHVTAIIICFAGHLKPDPSMHPIHPTHPTLPPTRLMPVSFTTADKYKVSGPAGDTVYSPPSSLHVDTWTRDPPPSLPQLRGAGGFPTHHHSLVYCV